MSEYTVSNAYEDGYDQGHADAHADGAAEDRVCRATRRAEAAEVTLARVRDIVEAAEDLAANGAFIRNDPYEMTKRLRAALDG
ncbi:MAG TPA: hypothetical protein VK204_05740 [Nocardioidaceae bacterium]|nr:hypothetical protein [Nocardioidaceae bacterium]